MPASPYTLIPSLGTTCRCGKPCKLLLAETWLPAFYICPDMHIAQVGVGEVREVVAEEDEEPSDEDIAHAVALARHRRP